MIRLTALMIFAALCAGTVVGAVDKGAHRGDLVVVSTRNTGSTVFRLFTPGGKTRFSLPTGLQSAFGVLKSAVSLDGKIAFTTVNSETEKDDAKKVDLLVTRIAGAKVQVEGRFKIPGLREEGPLKNCHVAGSASGGAVAAGTPLSGGSKPLIPFFVGVNCDSCGTGGRLASRSYVLKLRYDSVGRRISSAGRLQVADVSGGKRCTKEQTNAIQALAVYPSPTGTDELFAVIMAQDAKTYTYKQLTGRQKTVTSYRAASSKCINFAGASRNGFFAACPSQTNPNVYDIVRVVGGKFHIITAKGSTTSPFTGAVATLAQSNTVYTHNDGVQLSTNYKSDIASFDKNSPAKGRRIRFQLPKLDVVYDLAVVP